MPTISIENLVLPPPPRLPARSGSGGEFTTYVDAAEFRRSIQQAVDYRTKDAKSFDFQGSISLGAGGSVIYGRGHAALCFEGRKFSVSVRSGGIGKVVCDGISDGCLPSSDILPSNQALYDALMGSARTIDRTVPTGLVLVAGATGAGKTTALNELLTLHLKARLAAAAGKPKPRLPHVVVIGDPVETFLFTGSEESLPASCNAQDGTPQRVVDFTPRLLGTDVTSVGAALDDALRETPEVVIVSELRAKEDFAAALNFAATGHRLFATCHSGSLVEAFGKLLNAASSTNSASDRAALVRRLAAIVHIEVFGKGLRVPAIWTPSARGRQDFVSDGLSSIIPASPEDEAIRHAKGVLGRHWMLKKMQRVAGVSARDRKMMDMQMRHAFARDLRGA